MEDRGMSRGAPRSASAGDSGYCSLHGKRRSRYDLIPWSQQPGKMRCVLNKECTGGALQRSRGRGGFSGVGGPDFRRGMLRGRGGFRGRGGAMGSMMMPGRGRGFSGGLGGRGVRRDFRGVGPTGSFANRRERGFGGESVMCRLHRCRRPFAFMREVGSGVFECTDGHRCRQVGDRPLRGADGMRGRFSGRRGTSAPFRGGFADRGQRRSLRHGDRFGPQSQEQRYDEANASAWTPSAGGGSGMGGGGLRRRGGRVERKVWCALHGKPISASLCEFLQDCCYVCRDPSTCLSTPFEADTSRLMKSNCTEVLCSKHHTLRHVGFLELNKEKVAYQCVEGQECRGVTVPHMGQEEAAAASADKVVTLGGMPEFDDDVDGAYVGSRVSNTFLPQSGRDNVSSFFL